MLNQKLLQDSELNAAPTWLFGGASERPRKASLEDYTSDPFLAEGLLGSLNLDL